MIRLPLLGNPARVLALVALAWCTFAPHSARAATVYDLVNDWSDSNNPNGSWSYFEGGNLLPHVSSWQGLSGDFSTAQPAWARFATGNQNLPCFFKSSGIVGIPHDWLDGDVLCHTTDPANGVGSGGASVMWTSPSKGTATVSGAVWMGRDINRSNHWSIFKNGILLTGGDISSGDPYSHANPFTFSAGSGGAAAISNLSVNPNDQIALNLDRTSNSGDYVGIHFTVTLVTPVGVGAGEAAARVVLEAPRPNPSRGPSELRFSLPRGGPVSLEIFDVSGRPVRRLLAETMEAGPHSTSWDARDSRGQAVQSGIYLCRLQSEGTVLIKRMAVLK